MHIELASKTQQYRMSHTIPITAPITALIIKEKKQVKNK